MSATSIRMSKEFVEAAALLKGVRTANILDQPHPVIPIKTGGRWYGSISQQLIEREIKTFPSLTLGGAQYSAPYIYVAVWDDGNTYDDEHFYTCAGSCLVAASHAGLDKFQMPLIGGRQNLPALELGFLHHADVLDEAGFPVPEWEYVFT